MVLLSAAVERAVLLCCSTGVVLLSTVVVNGCGSTLAVAECYSLFLQEVLLLLAVRLDGVLGQELHELQRLLDLHQDLVDLSALDLREREREREGQGSQTGARSPHITWLGFNPIRQAGSVEADRK